ncbi:MAG: thiW protein [Firmicutes bacterium]|nr:thiW protein [Bacillota bacterium]
MHSRKLAYTALFIAVGVLSAHLVYIPIGIAKCFPLQHVINILLAVLLGTRYSVSAAFGISVLRNILGTGSLLAFPGSMVGAALAGLLYKKTNSIWGAIIGEVIGTGFIGALLAYPMAKYFIGSQAGAFFFIIPFTVSTVGGSIIAYFLYKANIVNYLQYTLGTAEPRNVAK